VRNRNPKAADGSSARKNLRVMRSNVFATAVPWPGSSAGGRQALIGVPQSVVHRVVSIGDADGFVSCYDADRSAS
jgi:hypothetical protein